MSSIPINEPSLSFDRCYGSSESVSNTLVFILCQEKVIAPPINAIARELKSLTST